jgi:hypothetical protein
VQKRFGWNTPDMVKEGQHNRFYNAIEITPILYRMVAVEVDDEGEEVVSPAAGRQPTPRGPKVNRLMEAADAAGA